MCRSCVGRNLANLELLVIIASVFRRYEFVLEEPNAEVGLAVMVSNGIIGAVLISMSQLAIREGSCASRSIARLA